MTRDEMIETVAAIIRDDTGCGLHIEGSTAFCDDPRAPPEFRSECSCRGAAIDALDTIEPIIRADEREKCATWALVAEMKANGNEHPDATGLYIAAAIRNRT